MWVWELLYQVINSLYKTGMLRDLWKKSATYKVIAFKQWKGELMNECEQYSHNLQSKYDGEIHRNLHAWIPWW